MTSKRLGVFIKFAGGLSVLSLLLIQLLWDSHFSAFIQIYFRPKTSQEQCSDDPWPDLELFLTTSTRSDHEDEYNYWFLQSLAIFFPQRHLKLLIVTDADKPISAAFAKKARDSAIRLMPRIKGVRSALVRKPFNEGDGWDKSQWIKMWADNYTNATYVGFVDTDSVFVTRVLLSDLFIGGKPVLRPIYGKPRQGWNGQSHVLPSNTYKYLGLKEPFNCMSFFPMIVKTEHLRFVRQQMLKNMDNSSYFDKEFQTLFRRHFYSEYGMMCTVLWWLFRDDYYWVINETELGWIGLAPPGQVANLEEAEITEDLLNRTRPHLTVHYTHYPNSSRPSTIQNLLKKGVCYSLPENHYFRLNCTAYNRTASVNEAEFIFEHDDFSKRPGAYVAHLERLKLMDACPHDWIKERISDLFNNIFMGERLG